MDVIYTHCAGLDVHKKTVVVCCMTPGPKGEKLIEQRTFGTMTADLLALSDWLTNQRATHVAIESTGEFPGLTGQDRLEADLQPAGRPVRDLGRQCQTRQERARPQDGC